MILPKEMRHLAVLPSKPKYKGGLKYDNLDAVRALHRRITAIADVKERSSYHWTATFPNGKRIEVYPTALAAGGAQHVWYFADALNLIMFVELSADQDRGVGVEPEDDVDVIEDF